MWESSFNNTSQPITEAFLHRHVLPSWGEAFEKISVAMSVRLALSAKNRPAIHYFLIPCSSEKTACYLAAGLLVGNLAHSNGGANLPSNEAGNLWKGDLLLVTPAVTQSKASLAELKLMGNQPLSDLWEITTLSRYCKTKSQRPRVFLSNPGWVLKGLSRRRFGVVVLDATHPRTMRRLAELVEGPLSEVPLKIIVAPPLGKESLASCNPSCSVSTWMWDPGSKRLAAKIVNDRHEDSPLTDERTIWVCDEDPEANNALEGVYLRMVDVLQKTAGKAIPGLPLCWAAYHRLRQLTVSLPHLEEISSTCWAGSLKDLIASLDQVEGRGNPVWETDWSDLRDAVEHAYQLLLEREDPAKFWVLALRVEKWLQDDSDDVLRIVVRTEKESTLLASKLGNLIDGMADARANGRLEIVSASEEAKRIAERAFASTILAGPRPAYTRHLDVYPCWPIEELAYPFEAGIEKAAQAQLYSFAGQLQKDTLRTNFLHSLGLTTSDTPIRGSSPAPPIRCLVGTGQEIQLVAHARVDEVIDIDRLASSGEYGLLDEEPPLANGIPCYTPQSGNMVDVHFTNGEVVRYPIEHYVDVFFRETEQMQRKRVENLRRGWNVVSFVDARYDSLFKRLTEAVEQRLPQRERIALALWREAKKAALKKTGGNRKLLHEALQQLGLRSDYSTMTTWFRYGDEEVLAPQQQDDFLILATYSGCYPDNTLRLHAFRAIQAERGRNRTAGRSLKGFLRAMLSGEGYENTIGKLESSLGDIAAAVELLEVADVQSHREIVSKETANHE